VNLTEWSKSPEVTADGEGIVSHAGVVLLRALADRTGLSHAQVGEMLALERTPQSIDEPVQGAEGELGAFGELLAAADWKFYDIDPMLFSPAAVTLTSTESGRAHHGGALAPEVLERSFTG